MVDHGLFSSSYVPDQSVSRHLSVLEMPKVIIKFLI